MREELKPCPFCGTQATYEDEADGTNRPHYIGCADSHCQMGTGRYFETKHAALIAWNMRPSNLVTLPREVVEEVTDFLKALSFSTSFLKPVEKQWAARRTEILSKLTSSISNTTEGEGK